MFIKSVLPIKAISTEVLTQFIESATLIVDDINGPKVMRRSNGNMIKLFRRKRLISSALFVPYAFRFCSNAFRIKELGIPTITPVALSYCNETKTHMVEYIPLPGKPLRETPPDNDDLITKTAQFIAELHTKGIYFRSIHFNNIICHEGELGLIDVADMKIYKKPLNDSLRQRNFWHIMRYSQDAERIKQYGINKFIEAYKTKTSYSRQNMTIYWRK